MAGFCLAGISAAAIRGKKSPLKLGQQLQLRGAEVICLLVPPEPVPAGQQQKCPGWGRTWGRSQPFLSVYWGEPAQGQRPRHRRVIPLGEGDLVGGLAGTWQLGWRADGEMQNKLQDEKHGERQLVPCPGSARAPVLFREVFPLAGAVDWGHCSTSEPPHLL